MGGDGFDYQRKPFLNKILAGVWSWKVIVPLILIKMKTVKSSDLMVCSYVIIGVCNFIDS